MDDNTAVVMPRFTKPNFFVYKKDSGLLGIYQTKKKGFDLLGTFNSFYEAKEFCKQIDEERD